MKRLILLPIALAALTACVPLQPVKDFASASRDVGTTARSAYVQFDSELAKAKYTSAMLRGEPVTPETFSGILTKDQGMEIRADMLDGLVNYASALETLATKNTSAEINSAAADISAQLKAFEGDYKALGGTDWPLTSSDNALIASAFKVTADASVLQLRRNAIRNAVVKSDPAIQKISTLLQQELTSMGTVIGGYYLQNETAFITAYEQKKAALSPGEILAYGEMIKVIHDRIQDTPAFYGKVATCCEKIGVTHAKLRASTGTREFLSKEFVDDVKDLVSYVKETKNHYKELAK